MLSHISSKHSPDSDLELMRNSEVWNVRDALNELPRLATFPGESSDVGIAGVKQPTEFRGDLMRLPNGHSKPLFRVRFGYRNLCVVLAAASCVSFVTGCSHPEASQWTIIDGRKPSVDRARYYAASIQSLESISPTSASARPELSYSCEGSETFLMVGFPEGYTPTESVGVRVGRKAVDSSRVWQVAHPTAAYPGGILFLANVTFDDAPVRSMAGDTVSLITSPVGRIERPVRFDLRRLSVIIDTARAVCRG